jgi:hypothetical protein
MQEMEEKSVTGRTEFWIQKMLIILYFSWVYYAMDITV